MYWELQEDTVGSLNKNRRGDKGFLEEVTFELKHKGRKGISQAKDKVEGDREESLWAMSKLKHGDLATVLCV